MILPPHLMVKGGHLWIGGQDTQDLAQRFGTPLYVTDEDRIRENFRRLAGALTAHYPNVRILYAAKANGNLAVFRILASMGAGADVFSAGEVSLALAAGMRPESLLFNGSSKSAADLALAVEKGIKVSVDSLDELRQLNAAAAEAGKTVEIAFRVNPEIDVPTHQKIATGLATSKFGIPAGQILDAYREALDAGHVNPVGIHCHIGSQILAVEPFAREVEVLIRLASDLIDIGADLSFIDIGGGLGIPYRRETDRARRPRTMRERSCPSSSRGYVTSGSSQNSGLNRAAGSSATRRFSSPGSTQSRPPIRHLQTSMPGSTCSSVQRCTTPTTR